MVSSSGSGFSAARRRRRRWIRWLVQQIDRGILIGIESAPIRARAAATAASDFRWSEGSSGPPPCRTTRGQPYRPASGQGVGPGVTGLGISHGVPCSASTTAWDVSATSRLGNGGRFQIQAHQRSCLGCPGRGRGLPGLLPSSCSSSWGTFWACCQITLSVLLPGLRRGGTAPVPSSRVNVDGGALPAPGNRRRALLGLPGREPHPPWGRSAPADTAPPPGAPHRRNRRRNPLPLRRAAPGSSDAGRQIPT